jgi:hypothetical protein
MQWNLKRAGPSWYVRHAATQASASGGILLGDPTLTQYVRASAAIAVTAGPLQAINIRNIVCMMVNKGHLNSVFVEATTGGRGTVNIKELGTWPDV